jgi:hypothetical protein
MQVEILTNQRTRSLLLIPGNAEEWELLTSLKHIHPMMPGVGSSLFLTNAPYTENPADSPRAMAGTALRIVECSPSSRHSN